MAGQPVHGIPVQQQQQYPPQGYPPQGYPPQGYPPQGGNPYQQQGYSPQGQYKQQPPPMYQQQGQQPSPSSPQAGYQQVDQTGGGSWDGKADPHYGQGAVTGTPLYPDVPQQQGSQRFIVQGCKDVPFAILFVLTLAGTAALFVVAMGKDDPMDFDMSEPALKTESYLAFVAMWPSQLPPEDTNVEDPAAPNLGIWIPAACAIAFFIGLAFLAAMKACPKVFIWVSNIAMACFLIGIALMTFSIYLGIIGLFVVAWLFCVRHRIPFASALLEAAITIVFDFPATLFVAIMSIVVGVAYVFVFMVALKPNLARYQDVYSFVGDPATCGPQSGLCSNLDPNYIACCVQKENVVVPGEEGNAGLLFVLIFFQFWAFQVLTGVVHVTVCGVAATWFFFKATQMPHNPTCKSFKRATTWSFGSICFGSLIVAILKMIKLMVRMAMDNQNGALRCIVMCILDCIDQIMQYFNKWAFAQIAIYGKSFIEAAKATFRMIKDGSVWQGIIADCLVDTALDLCQLIGSLAVGLLTGLIANSFVLGIICFFISFQILQVMMGTVDSCIIAIFICTSEAKHMLQLVNPQLYQIFMNRCNGLPV